MKDLHETRLAHIADVVPLVLKHYALRADVDLFIFTEEFGALIRVLEAVLFSRLLLSLLLLLFLLGAHMLLTVEIVQDSKILYQLFHVRAEIGSTSWTSEYVARPEVHQTVLTKSMAAGQNPRNLLLVIVLVKADRARHFHPVLLVCRAQLECR